MTSLHDSQIKMLFSYFSLSWRLEYDQAVLAMKCKQWTRRLAYTYISLILTFASSLILMVYMHSSSKVRVRNESFPISVNEGAIQNNLIPLVDFKDLGSRKPRLLLLVAAGSAPQRYDRRQAIRATWWKHCKHSQVNMARFTAYLETNCR